MAKKSAASGRVVGISGGERRHILDLEGGGAHAASEGAPIAKEETLYFKCFVFTVHHGLRPVGSWLAVKQIGMGVVVPFSSQRDLKVLVCEVENVNSYDRTPDLVVRVFSICWVEENFIENKGGKGCYSNDRRTIGKADDHRAAEIEQEPGYSWVT